MQANLLIPPQGENSGDTSGSTTNFISAAYDQILKWENLLSSFDRPVDGPNHDWECKDVVNDFFWVRALEKENLRAIARTINFALHKEMPIKKLGLFLNNLCESHGYTVQLPKAEVYKAAKDSRAINKENALLRKISRTPPGRLREKYENEMADIQLKENDRQSVVLTERAQQLLSGPHPVPFAIEYGPAVLYGELDPLPAHASVVVGRQFNEQTKTCDFLVRNSYGNACARKGKAYTYPCDRGTIAVPARELMRSTSKLTWLPSSAPLK